MRWAAVLVLLAWRATTGHAAPPPASEPVPWPGVGGVFGSSNQPFTPKTLFPAAAPPAEPAYLLPPPAPPPPPVVPVTPDVAVYAAADGGLFPPLLPTPVPPPPPVWTGSVETGLNGANGNADLFNLRVAAGAKRKVAGNVFVSDFTYTYTAQNGATKVNQALWNARDEVLFPGSAWSLFAALQLEYDQLRVYEMRTGLYGGAGYTVADDKYRTFKLRAGAGAVREIATGSVPDRWVPEAVFGYDFRYRFNDRSAFLSVVDYYPRLDDWSKFRVRARAGYEYLLDPALGMVMRIGVQDRYDSDPGNARRNDLTYFATLGLKF